MRLYKQIFFLALSFVLVFVWNTSSLSDQTVPMLGLLVFIYLILSARKKGKAFLTMGGDGPLGIFILNTVILLLIFSTGSIDSPLFFLLYFLAFGIAFVFEPLSVFVFTIGTISILLPSAGNNSENLLLLGSLLLISPLAYFFGREYRKSDKKETEIEAIRERSEFAADEISKDVEEVLKDNNLDSKDVEKLNEILEETDDLREETKK